MSDSLAQTKVNSDLQDRIGDLGEVPLVTDASASNAFPILLNQLHELLIAAIVPVPPPSI